MLTGLDVSKCPELQYLDCYNNQLTSLDVSKCPALKGLYCSSNQLTSLDVSKCPELQYLACSSNQLTSLDVSKCPELRELYCDGNQLTSLDVSGCPLIIRTVESGSRYSDTDGCIIYGIDSNGEYLLLRIDPTTSVIANGKALYEVPKRPSPRKRRLASHAAMAPVPLPTA